MYFGNRITNVKKRYLKPFTAREKNSPGSCINCYLQTIRPQIIYFINIYKQIWHLITYKDRCTIQNPGSWAALDTATKEVTWPVTHHFGPNWVGRMVGEARSNQSAGHIKPDHQYDCPERILQVALAANKFPILIHVEGAKREWLWFSIIMKLSQKELQTII